MPCTIQASGKICCCAVYQPLHEPSVALHFDNWCPIVGLITAWSAGKAADQKLSAKWPYGNVNFFLFSLKIFFNVTVRFLTW